MKNDGVRPPMRWAFRRNRPPGRGSTRQVPPRASRVSVSRWQSGCLAKLPGSRGVSRKPWTPAISASSSAVCSDSSSGGRPTPGAVVGNAFQPEDGLTSLRRPVRCTASMARCRALRSSICRARPRAAGSCPMAKGLIGKGLGMMGSQSRRMKKAVMMTALGYGCCCRCRCCR